MEVGSAPLALAVPRAVPMVAGALVGGYLVGTLPVAWLVVRRSRRPGAPAREVALPRRPDRTRPGAVDALQAGGIRAALLTVALELAKGAIAGLGARLYDDAAWFTTAAIAGCVIGDAFPLAARRGRRGVMPLLSGVFAALPGTWTAGLLVAIPAVLVFALSGVALDALLAVCVPVAFFLGTRDARTLPFAALIVGAILARGRLRRRARREALEGLRGRRPGDPLVIDAMPPLRVDELPRR